MDELSSWRGQRVLVTGGSGFLGRRVVEIGRQAGVEVITASTGASGPGASDVTLDLRDAPAVRSTVSELRPGAVLHLAATGVRGHVPLPDLIEANGKGTAALVDALATRPVPLVAAGSGYEYASLDRAITEDDPMAPATPYGVSKAAATLCALWYGRLAPVTVLRVFNVFGIGERPPRLLPSLIEAARGGEPLDLTPCDQLRDFVYVDDVAEAFWCALVRSAEAGGPRILNLGSGEPVRLRVFVESAAAILRERGLSPELRFGARPYRVGEPMTYVADVRRVRETLGWSPRTSLDDGIRQAVEHAW